MKKILLVDDEKGVVAMMKSYFEMSGYQVLTAYNGAEALRQAVHQPDIILLDINMPGMDGLTVCKKIRDYISCPILFLTARIETADKIKGFQVGADDYIYRSKISRNYWLFEPKCRNNAEIIYTQRLQIASYFP